MDTIDKLRENVRQTSCLSYGQFTGDKCQRGKWVVLKKKIEKEAIFKRVFIPCQTYQCHYCRERRRKKLYKLINRACPKDKFSMLTLTLRKNSDPLKVNWKRLSKSWDILLKRLKRKCPAIKYFRCVELQKNGMPHIHALINFYLPKWYIQLIWKKITGDSFICRFEHVKSSCAGYILKYFEKSINDINYIRSATGKKTRIFNYSRNMLFVEKKLPEWSLICVCNSRAEAIGVLLSEKSSARHYYGQISPFVTSLDEDDFLLSFSFECVEDF